jgi:release factor glutamine methyltransferase
MTGNLTIGALLAHGIRRLRESSDARDSSGASGLDAELLLGYALDTSRARLKSHPEEIPDGGQSRRYAELIERRVSGEPLAYIIGRKDFWSLRLAVSPAVLVPRPETELLVERALALREEPLGRVADLGTGSGAIALALASERAQWRVVATDISDDALAIARANATALGLGHVEFQRGSWFEALPGQRFDLIVSNPPYVAEGDPALRQPALKHEPRIALTPGADGLTSLRMIIRSAAQHLERHGWLLLEHGADQAADVARELVVRGFRHVRSHRDLAGHERMTEAQWG